MIAAHCPRRGDERRERGSLGSELAPAASRATAGSQRAERGQAPEEFIQAIGQGADRVDRTHVGYHRERWQLMS